MSDVVMEFETKVRMEINYSSPAPVGLNYQSRNSDVRLRYQITINKQDFGIGSLNLFANVQEVSFMLSMMQTEKGAYKEYTFRIQIKELRIEKPSNYQFGTIAPTNMTLELTNLEVKDSLITGSAIGVLKF